MNNQKGWISLHRKICENDLWFLEPFTKAQAWIDLVLNANHKEGVINIRGNIITIKRGQIGWSEITMTERWQWSRNKVRRFLKWLETKQQIEQQKLYKLTSITTIINYDQYQTEQQTIQQTIQQKDNRRYTNNNVNNDNKEYMCSFEDFWKQYPKKVAKKKAKTTYQRLATSKKKEENIMQGLESYKKKWRTEKTDVKFVPNPVTWLNQERWADDIIISNDPYNKNARANEEKWKQTKEQERKKYKEYQVKDGEGGFVKLSELVKK